MLERSGRGRLADADQLTLQRGWVTEAQQIVSPNQDRRPPHTPIDVLVLHAISLPPGEYGGGHIEKFFCNALDSAAHAYFAEIQALQTSAHFLLDRAGRLTQFVATDKRAWHAGVSSFHGRTRVNDFSIGVELEGCDQDTFAPAQYATLRALTHCLMRHYPITPPHIVGHSDIAPQRKTDPGPGFDWQQFRAGLAGVEETPIES